jgi:ferredoxin
MGAQAMKDQGAPVGRLDADGKFAHFEIDDELCIGCGLCRERAPENLDTPPGSPVATVVRQPVSPNEESACREAAEYCPTGGILVEE